MSKPDKNEVNPAWVTAPYNIMGVTDERGLQLIRKQYPLDKYEVKVWGPYEFGLYFYEVNEK